MADDPRYLAEARIARLITALGEATSEEFAKTLETGSLDALEKLISRAVGFDPEAMMRKTIRERYTYLDGRRVVKKELPAPPEDAASTIHRVRVDLYFKPPIWRRLEIPSAMPLDQVSKVLQAAFGWSRYQTHQFETVYGRYGAPEHSGESSELDDWAPPEDETPVALAQVIPAKNARKISYVCNFHAMRRLGITLEEIAPAEPGTSYPRCTGGRRAAPSGDSHEIQVAGAADDEPFSPTQVTTAVQTHLAGRMSPD